MLQKIKNLIFSSRLVLWLGKYIPFERVYSGVFWTSIGQTVSSFANLVSSLILARLLGAANFGKFSVIQSILGVFIVLSGPSIGYLATRYVAELRHLNPRRTSAILKLSNISAVMLSACMASFMYFLSPCMAGNIMHSPELQPELYICAAILLFTGINGAQLGALTGFEAFREVAIVNIIKGVSILTLVTLGGYYYGIRGAISGYVVVCVMICIFSNNYVSKLMHRYNLPRISRSEVMEEFSLLFSFSLPTWLFSVVSALVNFWTYIMVSRIPQGYTQMGIFNAANQFFLVLNFVPMVLLQVSFPLFSNVAGKKDFQKLKVSYHKLIATNIICILLLIFILGPLSNIVMNRLGTEFSNQTTLLEATLLLTLVYVTANVAYQILIVIGHIWTSLFFVLMHSMLYVGVFILFEKNDAMGLAIARLVSYSVYAAVSIIYVEFNLAKIINKQRESYVP